MPEALNDAKITDVRSKICDIATRQCAENGWGNVSMRSIARELGYSATALYSYFKNKEHLLAATKTVAYKQLALHLSKSLNACDDPTKQFSAVGLAYYDFAVQEPASFELITIPDGSDHREFPELLTAIDAVRHTFMECAKNLGALQPIKGSSQHAARLFWSLLDGVVNLHATSSLQLPNTPIREFLNYAISVLQSGITSEGEEVKEKKGNEQFSFDL